MKSGEAVSLAWRREKILTPTVCDHTSVLCINHWALVGCIQNALYHTDLRVSFKSNIAWSISFKERKIKICWIFFFSLSFSLSTTTHSPCSQNCQNSWKHFLEMPLRDWITSCLQICQLHIQAANLLLNHIPRGVHFGFISGDWGSQWSTLNLLPHSWSNFYFVTLDIIVLELAIRRW